MTGTDSMTTTTAASPDVHRHGIPAESAFGYAQAIRSGDLVHVSGQLALDASGTFAHTDDLPAQLALTYTNLDRVLGHYGATRAQVVSQVVYVVDLHRYADAVADGNRAYFGGHWPVSTVVGVAGLTFPGQLVEISCVLDVRLPSGR
ncbi:Rid family hydrolase [Streptomyces sp. NPDC048290]|uniref:RidA family protein n=1 Tax=Streptomyces sp. NPDC048290 TaxID=3155811 RepID=UPI0034179FEB